MQKTDEDRLLELENDESGGFFILFGLLLTISGSIFMALEDLELGIASLVVGLFLLAFGILWLIRFLWLRRKVHQQNERNRQMQRLRNSQMSKTIQVEDLQQLLVEYSFFSSGQVAQKIVNILNSYPDSEHQECQRKLLAEEIDVVLLQIYDSIGEYAFKVLHRGMQDALKFMAIDMRL